MRYPFNGSFPQTQGFGEHPDWYKKFGLIGHNGLDYGMPNGTEIVAPHDGKILEATNDPNGYGLYVKIESSTEGSVLAHLKQINVPIGRELKEGEHIGFSNNTGNSTGPHLHWGYYKIPRNRKNGYAGFIDQTQFINAGSVSKEAYDVCMKDRSQFWKERDELKNENTEIKKQVINLNDQIATLNQQIATLKQEDVDAGQKELQAEKERDEVVAILNGVKEDIGFVGDDPKGLLWALHSLVVKAKEIERELTAVKEDFATYKEKMKNAGKVDILRTLEFLGLKILITKGGE